MEESMGTTKAITFEQLASLREKTETIAQFLKDCLKGHLETLRPAFAKIWGHPLEGSCPSQAGATEAKRAARIARNWVERVKTW